MVEALGDGLLVYFGYPRAHEDDAQRALRAGLGIVEALKPLQTRLQQEQGIGLAVRIGIHTGLVVVGDIGEGARHERLALGEAPNLAARLQGIAPSNTVLLSATTARLVQGWFVCEALGDQTLKGFPQPMPVYRVIEESGVQSRLDMVSANGLTPLVGREQEVELLLERWQDAKQGLGQVVVLSGEAGIGKSRLVRAIEHRLAGEPYTRVECRCSPYAQHSALYPVIDLGRRLLQWQRDEAPDVTLGKLEAALAPYAVSLPEVVPLLASLLSLPLSDRYTPLQLTPRRQKQKTLEAILALLLAHAAQQPVLFIVEDLHWIDPSTLELLTLFIDQGPKARILTVLTARPEFHPPWGSRAHMTSLTLGHLPPTQVGLMIDHVTAGKHLPAEVRQQVVAKTDGVPLFVEELTRTVLESGLLREQADHYELRGPLLSLAIPATLHDSLMARLDRLGEAKEVAQLGAILGRAFPYELLRAVSQWDDERLQRGLTQLVAADLLRGIPPRDTYVFKHALIQETAYQSLLKRTRQQYHRQTVHVLEQRFPEIVAIQPELLAYHCTEAGLPAQAVPYWQRAGQRAVERSANVEAVSHFTKGLELLHSLPATPERTRRELALQLALGPALRMIKGHTAPEVERVYTRTYELAQQAEDSRQRFSALVSLWRLSINRARIQQARELAEQCFTLSQSVPDPVFLQETHRMLGSTLFFLGEPVLARQHLEQGLALYDAKQGRSWTFSSGMDPGVFCLCCLAWVLWILGYPDSAMTKISEALTLARELSHAYSLTFALNHASVLHVWRREVLLAQERANEVTRLANEHGFIHFLHKETFWQYWMLAERQLDGDSVEFIPQDLSSWQSITSELELPHRLAMLADAHGQKGQVELWLRAVDGALALAQQNAVRHYEAELYRLKGELLLRQAIQTTGTLIAYKETPILTRNMHGRSMQLLSRQTKAEACFRQALHIARCQHAKSLELRAAVSLSHLWQLRGKQTSARQMLQEIYGWFTEGFETPDLQQARALLETLQQKDE